MDPDEADLIVFDCENCSSRIYVDDDMREELLTNGYCVECGKPISPSDFAPRAE